MDFKLLLKISKHFRINPYKLADTIDDSESLKNELDNNMDLVIDSIKMKGEYSLFEHQKVALKWMKEREKNWMMCFYGYPYIEMDTGIHGGILKLNMGLGKTNLSLAYTLIADKKEPVLAVVPKTIMYEWRNDIDKFYGNKLKVLYLHRNFMSVPEIDALTYDVVKAYDLVITTYDFCNSVCKRGKWYDRNTEYITNTDKIKCVNEGHKADMDHQLATGPDILYNIYWHAVICDESQRFANPSTKGYQYIMSLAGKYKWCLTGTPIRNNTVDIWAQLRFCGYTVIDRAIDWSRSYREYQFQNLGRAVLNLDYQHTDIVLPDKIEHEVGVNMDRRQLELYRVLLQDLKNKFAESLYGITSYAEILAMFVRLRQCIVAPYIITPESKRKETNVNSDIINEIKDTELGEWLFDKNGTAGLRSSKIVETVRIIKKIEQSNPGSKTIVFSMFKTALDLIYLALKKKGIKSVQIDGDVTGNARDRELIKFRTSPDHNVLLMTYKVGSEGLNITEATNCISLEPWWNNAVHNQAKARCWRTGQKNVVNSYTMVMLQSIEIQIFDLCKEKDKLSKFFIEGQDYTRRHVGLDRYTLQKILNNN